MSDANPFKGRRQSAVNPMRVLHAFSKGGRHAEITERRVDAVPAVEFLIFVDGVLRVSELFHGNRIGCYQSAVDERVQRFRELGWTADLK